MLAASVRPGQMCRRKPTNSASLQTMTSSKSDLEAKEGQIPNESNFLEFISLLGSLSTRGCGASTQEVEGVEANQEAGAAKEGTRIITLKYHFKQSGNVGRNVGIRNMDQFRQIHNPLFTLHTLRGFLPPIDLPLTSVFSTQHLFSVKVSFLAADL